MVTEGHRLLPFLRSIARGTRPAAGMLLSIVALAVFAPLASATAEQDADVVDTSRGPVHVASGNQSLAEILAEYFAHQPSLMPKIRDSVVEATPSLRLLSAGQHVPAGTRLFLPRIERRPEVAQLLHGELEVSGDRPRTVSAGQPLYHGEHVTVAGRQIVRLRLADGSSMRLWPGSELTLKSREKDSGDTVQRLLAHLKSGRLHAETDRHQHHALEVHMPSVHLGVRGTDFAARVCQQGSCDEGTIAVEDSDLVALLSGALVADSATNAQFDIEPLQVWQLESDGSAPKQRPDLASLLYGDEWPETEPRCRRFPRVDQRPTPRVWCANSSESDKNP